jgi:hypothetical protein
MPQLYGNKVGSIVVFQVGRDHTRASYKKFTTDPVNRWGEMFHGPADGNKLQELIHLRRRRQVGDCQGSILAGLGPRPRAMDSEESAGFSSMLVRLSGDVLIGGIRLGARSTPPREFPIPSPVVLPILASCAVAK